MIDFTQIPKSFRSLMMHRMRALLSTLGVLFGVVAVVAMLSIGEGAKQETLEQIEQLGTNSIILRSVDMTDEQQRQALLNRSIGLSAEDGAVLANAIEAIRHYAPLKNVEAQVTGSISELNPEVLAITPSFGEVKGLTFAEGRNICDRDMEGSQQVCIVGSAIAQALGATGHVGQTIRLENSQFLIVGVLQPKKWSNSKNNAMLSRNLNRSIMIPLGSEKPLTKKVAVRPLAVQEVILQLDNSSAIAAVTPAVKHIMERQHHNVDDYQIVIPLELMEQASRTQRTFNLVLGSIAAISLLVGGIGIMNIMLATVSERTREIGIRRAVGASRTHIVSQFLLETLLLTLSGALLGVLSGIAVSLAISAIAGWKTIVTAWSIILSFSMAGGVGLFSGLYPALKAAYMDPIAALRHV